MEPRETAGTSTTIFQNENSGGQRKQKEQRPFGGISFPTIRSRGCRGKKYGRETFRAPFKRGSFLSLRKKRLPPRQMMRPAPALFPPRCFKQSPQNVTEEVRGDFNARYKFFISQTMFELVKTRHSEEKKMQMGTWMKTFWTSDVSVCEKTKIRGLRSCGAERKTGLVQGKLPSARGEDRGSA
jgi:hypothetical protein